MSGVAAPTSVVAEVTMPRLSDSMQEGTVVRWLAQDGAAVNVGDEIVEIETDKATMRFEADATGTLRHLVGEGETVAVCSPIAEIRTVAGKVDADADGALARTAPQAAGRQPDINASSIARRFAEQLAIDLTRVSGSGPRGRILKADVRAYHEQQTPLPRPSAPQAGSARRPVAQLGSARRVAEPRREPLTRTQEIIARRMAESKSTIPEFTVRMTIDMERCVQLRQDLSNAPGDRGQVPSLNDVVIRAVALALRAHPRVNASYRDGEVELHSQINVGMAVAVAGALLVPTIFDAGSKTLFEISRDTRRLGEAARAGTLTPPELSGGTFTVSNLGMAGVNGFIAVINPPQAAILAVGRAARRPAVIGDELVPRWQMEVNLTCDHRVIYGADAAAFLGEVKQSLEFPLRMV